MDQPLQLVLNKKDGEQLIKGLELIDIGIKLSFHQEFKKVLASSDSLEIRSLAFDDGVQRAYALDCIIKIFIEEVKKHSI